MVEKSSAEMLDEFRNPGDRWSQHEFFLSHRLHQHDRNAFALARQHYQVSVPVIGRKCDSTYVTDQVDAALESHGRDLTLQSGALRPFANDPAKEVETLIAKHVARLDQKTMVFYPMQPSDREQTEASVGSVGSDAGWKPRWAAIDTETMDDDFVRRCRRIFLKNKSPVVVGHRYTKATGTKLGLEQVRALQQIGAVQGKAESDTQKLSRGQGHPRREVSMVSMDVFDIERSQLFRQRCTHDCVTEGTNAAAQGRSRASQ